MPRSKQNKGPDAITKKTPTQDEQLKEMLASIERISNDLKEAQARNSATGASIDETKKSLTEAEDKMKTVGGWMEKIKNGTDFSAIEIENAKEWGIDLSSSVTKEPIAPTPEPAKTPEPKKKTNPEESKAKEALIEYSKSSEEKATTLLTELKAKTDEQDKITAILESGTLPKDKKLADFKNEFALLKTRVDEIKKELKNSDDERMAFEKDHAIGFADVDLDKRVALIGTQAETIRVKAEKDRTADEQKYLQYADAIEKEAKRRGRSSEDLAKIAHLTSELKKSPIKLSTHEEGLLKKKELRENKEGIISAYKKKKEEQDILGAKIALLKKAAKEHTEKMSTTRQEDAQYDTIYAHLEMKTNEWNAGDKELRELAVDLQIADPSFWNMNAKTAGLTTKSEKKNLANDVANRERRRVLFAKKTALEEAELSVAEKTRDLNAKFAKFIGADGNIIKDLKHVSLEDRKELEAFLTERETLLAERTDMEAKRGAFAGEQKALFDELKGARALHLNEKLISSRDEYTTKYAEHYEKMNGFKKWGINAFKRLGLVRDDAMLPKDLKDLKKNYAGAIDAVATKERLMREGMSEQEAVKVMGRFQKKFIKIENVKAEQEIINKMRVDAFESDKKGATRKALKYVKYVYTLGMAGLGAATGGATYITSKVIGILAGAFVARQVDRLLARKWQHEENMHKRMLALEADFKAGHVSPSEYDRRMQEIERLKNGAQATKKAIVLAAAFAAGYGAKLGAEALYGNYVPENEGGNPDDKEEEAVDRTEDEGDSDKVTTPEEQTDKPETIAGPKDGDPTPPAPIEKFTMSVEVEKGQGAISMFEDLQDKLEEHYLDDQGNLIDPLNTPDDVAHMLSVPAEQLAVEYGMWDLNADAAGGNGNESALIELHATLSIDQDGRLVFENPSGEPQVLDDGIDTTPASPFDGRFLDSNDSDGSQDSGSGTNQDTREWKIAGDGDHDNTDNHGDQNTDQRDWKIADNSADHPTSDYPPADSAFDKPIDAGNQDGQNNTQETSTNPTDHIETSTEDFVDQYGNDFSLNSEGHMEFNNLVEDRMNQLFGTQDITGQMTGGIDNFQNDYPLLTSPDYSAQDVLDIMNDPANVEDFNGSPIYETIHANGGILGSEGPGAGESFTHYLLNSVYENLPDDYKYQ